MGYNSVADNMSLSSFA